jgi:hypothetical protein
MRELYSLVSSLCDRELDFFLQSVQVDTLERASTDQAVTQMNDLSASFLETQGSS